MDEEGKTLSVGSYLIPILTANCNESENIQILFETPATEIIMENGAAVGVVVNDGENEFNIHAGAVVLASGGFGGNNEMVAQYKPEYDGYITTNAPGIDGDGIVMGEAVGAATVDMDQIQLLYLGNTQDGQLTKYPPRDVNGTDQVIFINKEGERFVREDGRRDEICLAVMAQTDSMFYILESADGAGYVDIQILTGDRRMDLPSSIWRRMDL